VLLHVTAKWLLTGQWHMTSSLALLLRLYCTSLLLFACSTAAVLLHVSAKWLLIGRYKPGVHPIYGLHYVAWWIERLLFKVRPNFIIMLSRGRPTDIAHRFLLSGAFLLRGALLPRELSTVPGTCWLIACNHNCTAAAAVTSRRQDTSNARHSPFPTPSGLLCGSVPLSLSSHPTQNVQAVLLPYTRGTALHNVYLRSLGARIAPDTVCDAEDVSEYDLVELQAGAFVGGNTVISPGSKQALSSKEVG
jgi:hypothetical protein